MASKAHIVCPSIITAHSSPTDPRSRLIWLVLVLGEREGVGRHLSAIDLEYIQRSLDGLDRISVEP